MRILIGFLALLFFAGSVDGAQTKHPLVVLETTQGPITLEIREDLAPLAAENFVTHVKNGYYNGIIFHRIIKGFMIQGGDPTGTGRGGESMRKKSVSAWIKSTSSVPRRSSMSNAMRSRRLLRRG